MSGEKHIQCGPSSLTLWPQYSKLSSAQTPEHHYKKDHRALSCRTLISGPPAGSQGLRPATHSGAKMAHQPSPHQTIITSSLISKLGRHPMTAMVILGYPDTISSKENILIFQFVNDPQQGYIQLTLQGCHKVNILRSFKLSQTTQNMGSYSEGSSRGTLAYLVQWTCSGSSTKNQALKNELHIMSL